LSGPVRNFLRSCALAATVLVVFAGCGSEALITIELEELNGSGISGKVELEPVGERTRITVSGIEAGDITGARVMHNDPCDDGVDDKYTIKPPSGIVGVEFEQFRRWDDAGPLTAAFLRSGRYVACGTT